MINPKDKRQNHFFFFSRPAHMLSDHLFPFRLGSVVFSHIVSPLFPLSFSRSLHLPSSIHRVRLWHPFIRSNPHFPPTVLIQGDHFCPQLPSFCRITNTCSKSISTTIYNSFLFSSPSPPFIHSGLFLHRGSLFCALEDRGRRFASDQGHSNCD